MKRGRNHECSSDAERGIDVLLMREMQARPSRGIHQIRTRGAKWMIWEKFVMILDSADNHTRYQRKKLRSLLESSFSIHHSVEWWKLRWHRWADIENRDQCLSYTSKEVQLTKQLVALLLSGHHRSFSTHKPPIIRTFPLVSWHQANGDRISSSSLGRKR